MLIDDATAQSARANLKFWAWREFAIFLFCAECPSAAGGVSTVSGELNFVQNQSSIPVFESPQSKRMYVVRKDVCTTQMLLKARDRLLAAPV